MRRQKILTFGEEDLDLRRNGSPHIDAELLIPVH
jgi:hypothetical protein